MAINLIQSRQLLNDFDFGALFIEQLGWSQPASRRVESFDVDGQTCQRRQIAQLAGAVVFEVTCDEGRIPDAKTRRAIHKEISKHNHENLLIFIDADRTRSLWYWVKRQDGKLYPRDHHFFRGQPGDLFLSKISEIVFDLSEFDESGNVSIVQVTERLHSALDIERVTKKFYGEFQTQHLEFMELIEGVDDDHDRRWYASVLLNRLMFIYFLQKKFFIDGGDANYLRNKLAACQAKGKNRYFQDFLKVLFFEGFAKPEAQRTAAARKLLGDWVWNIKGTPRVLYNLPYVASTPIEDWVFIVEGEKDADNLREFNIAATTNSGGAGKWHQVADDSVLHGRQVAIIPDNDEPGREHAQQVAMALHGRAKVVKIIKLPRIPAKGDVSDWLARFNEPNGATPYIRIRRYASKAKDFVPAGLALCENADTSVETDWPDPQPLPEDLPPVKAFDPTLLPSTLRGWIVDIAERMQCPPDFPAVASMVALSGILGRKIVIRPKQKDNWTVYPNLWGMLIGRPSLMKSPPMKETLLPIRRMTAEALEQYEQEVAEYMLAQDLYGITTKLAKDKIAKAMKAGDDSEDLQAQFASLQPPEKPKRKRYTVNDATVEALGEILSANPNGVILERDELMGFLKSLERAGQEGARAFFLETWTGDATFETDRIGRGNVRIDGVCLSVLGTIQPGPLGMYLNETLRGGTGDDGLMQRFQLAVWPDDPGPWKVVDRWPDADARDLAYEVYRRFDDLPAAQLGELPDAFESSNIPFLRFDPAAQERFYDWMTTRENHLRSGKEHPAVESHLTKYRKLIPALALVIHLAEGREGPVVLQALEAAIGWGDYLESHARRIYSCGIDPAVAHARALVQRIQQGDVADGFTVRDVYHGRHWSMLADAAQVQLAVDELVELGWLRVEEVPTSGRPARLHRINPKVVAMSS